MLLDGLGRFDCADHQEVPAHAALPLLLHRPREDLGVPVAPGILPDPVEPPATTTVLNGRRQSIAPKAGMVCRIGR